MNSVFVTAVQDILVTEPIGRFEVDEGLFLLNDPLKFRELIAPEFAEAMGSLEYRHLIDRGCGFAARDKGWEYSADELVRTRLDLVHLFFQALWLVKDNAARCELAFVELSEGNRRTWSSNFRTILYFNADGSTASAKFSLAELREARRLLKEWLLPLYAEISREQKDVSVVSQKNTPRLVRVIFFLSAARHSFDLGVKIALYITCLEIIFSTNPSELAHRMSERVAWTLSGTPQERAELYGFLKRAYEVRSKIVHGDVLSDGKSKELANVSSRLDDVLRRVLQKFFSTDYLRLLLGQKAETIENYYVRLVLGAEIKLARDGA